MTEASHPTHLFLQGPHNTAEAVCPANTLILSSLPLWSGKHGEGTLRDLKTQLTERDSGKVRGLLSVPNTNQVLKEFT